MPVDNKPNARHLAFALAATVMLSALLCCAGAAAGKVIPSPTPQSTNVIYNFFQYYGFSNYTVDNSTYKNLTLGKDTYIMMFLNGSQGNFTFINTTNKENYSLVLNFSTAYALTRPYLIAKYYPSNSTIANLTSYMKDFRASSQAPINDCLTETGLSINLCTTGDNVTTCLAKSCQQIPVCTDVLRGVGIPSPFASGIYNFSLQYLNYNYSVNSYLKFSRSINQNNVGSNLQQMQSLVSSISNLAGSIGLNPVFPPPTNISAQDESSICGQYGTSGGPWYCYAVGFCEYTSFNYTYLNASQGVLTNLLSEPITNSTIQSITQQAVKNAYYYWSPAVNITENATFNAFLKTELPKYNALVVNMSFVASHYSNATLASYLSTLLGTYNSIIAAGPSQNITAANATLSAAIANGTKIYTTASAKYLPVYYAAYNNTLAILRVQLDYQNVPYAISNLAAQQADINAQLQGQVNESQLATINSKVDLLSQQVSGISGPLSFTALVRAYDVPPAQYLAAKLTTPTTPLQSVMGLTTIIMGILAFIEGIIVILIVYMLTYFRLSHKHKLNMRPGVKTAWTLLFSVLVILAAIYAFAIYAYGQNANTFVPIDGFLSTIKAAPTAYILVNSTIANNASVIQCVASLKNTLSGRGTTVYAVPFYNTTCVLPPSSTKSTSTCLKQIADSGLPTVIINGGANLSVVYKGAYGDTLYASTSAANGASCILNALLK